MGGELLRPEERNGNKLISVSFCVKLALDVGGKELGRWAECLVSPLLCGVRMGICCSRVGLGWSPGLELWREVAFLWEKHLGAAELLGSNSAPWGHASGNTAAARMGKVEKEQAGDACLPAMGMPMAKGWNWMTFKVPSNPKYSVILLPFIFTLAAHVGLVLQHEIYDLTCVFFGFVFACVSIQK